MFLVVGCEKQPEKQAAAPTAPPKAAGPSPTKIVARSGDIVVSEKEAQEALAASERSAKMMFGGKMPQLTQEQKAQQRKNVIRQLVVRKLLIKKAKEAGFTATDEEVDKRLSQMFQMYGGKEKFLERVGKKGCSDEELRRDVADSIITEKYIEKEVYSKVPEPTEEEMRQWYEKHKGQFSRPEMVKVSTITIKLGPGASDDQVAKAKEKIEKIAGRLSKGESFAALAKELSQDEFASRGGDRGFVRRGRSGLGREFEDAIFALKVGQVSGPIRTKDGFCLAKVTERRQPKELSYEEARDQIKKILPGLNKFKEMAKFHDKLKRETKIEYY